MTFKRTLYLTHRWLGVGMCLLFLLWFASGIILMYVEYPELTEEERLENLPALALEAVALSAAEAIDTAAPPGGASSVVLSTVAGRPAYLIEDAHGGMRTVFADDGAMLDTVSRKEVMATVRQSGFVPPQGDPAYDALIGYDQWTVSSVLDEHRPLHRVELGDRAGRVLYVSSATGQIVRDTDRNERFWNWLGTTIHWIYPVQLRRHVDVWTQLLIYLSLAGVISVITGGIVGLLRLRLKRRYKGNRVTPYRGAAWWHHVSGLVCFVFIATFIFSGLMSMSPWGMFEPKFAPEPQIERYTGGAVLPSGPFPRLEALPVSAAVGVKEIEWLQIAGTGYLALSRSATDRQALLGPSGAHEDSSAALLERIRNAIPAMLPDAELASLETIADYDDYYYSRHNRYRPLPVYRAKFADIESTWFHIDQNTGKVVTRLTDSSRLARWLYNGLHSLDFSFLISRGIAWDITVIVLSIAGIVFSISSVIIGWRRGIYGMGRGR